MSIRQSGFPRPSRKLSAGSDDSEKPETPSRISDPSGLAGTFPLSWSHYVLLVRRSRSDEARRFYETEALRGGWSVRQLKRQIDSQFYERTALSKDKATMLTKGQVAHPEDTVTAREAIKDPYVLEFLDLKDEYSEGENPPVGLILCAQKDAAVAHYALDGLPNEVMAAEYRTALPDEKELVAEIERTRAVLDARGASLPEGEPG